MIKDLLFALELGLKVIGVFIFCLFIGVNVDAYFHTQPIWTLIMIILAFTYVIKLLLGVYRNG